jgi:hypothetical protein
MAVLLRKFTGIGRWHGLASGTRDRDSNSVGLPVGCGFTGASKEVNTIACPTEHIFF